VKGFVKSGVESRPDWLAVCALVLMLSACASNPGDEDQSKTAASGNHAALICTREKVAGSHMTKKVCRTKRQIEIDRREEQSMRDQDSVLQPRVGDGL
jgi:hypothetical protein